MKLQVSREGQVYDPHIGCYAMKLIFDKKYPDMGKLHGEMQKILLILHEEYFRQKDDDIINLIELVKDIDFCLQKSRL